MKKSIGILILLLAIGLPLFSQSYTNLTPGLNPWKDNSGNHINAHGGCILYENGYYYLFGESRSGSVTNGISCYKSSDLYNWKYLGLALSMIGTMRDDLNDIAPGRTLERPKVVYNKKTGKYVMWCHWENGTDYGCARVVIAYSSSIIGPYTFVKTMRPNGQDSRDQTILVTRDSMCYHVCTTNMNSDLQFSELTDDFLDVTGTRILNFKGKKYEAPAFVEVDSTYFGIFSECTGWNPNPGHSGISKDFLNGWSDQPNFCVDEKSNLSYSSQSSFILKYQGKENCYIYCGDRWNSSNVGASLYVWLPMSFRSGYPTVNWYDSWDVSVFNDMYRYKRARKIEAGNTYSLLARISNRLISTTSSSFVLYDDDDTKNLKFLFEGTGETNVYKIKDKTTGKYLESLVGARLALSDVNTKASQNWVFKQLSDNYYYISNQNDSKTLTVSGASTLNGTSVYLDDKKYDITQRFGVYFDSYAYTYEADDFISKGVKIIPDTTSKDTITGPTLTKVVYAPENFKVDIFPTANNGNFDVLINTKDNNGSVKLQVITLSGRVIYTTTIKAGTRSALQLSGVLSKGAYILSAQARDNVLNKKFVVQ